MRLSGVVYRGSCLAGIPRLLHRGNGAVVLYYHGIAESISHAMVQSNQIRADVFENQLRYLVKNFEIVSLDELYEGVTGRRVLGRRQVAITFDDGYRNNLTVAAPILRQYGAPFTVFVSTKHITTGARVPSYYFRTITFANPNPRLALRTLGGVWDISTTQRQTEAYRQMASKMKRLDAAGLEEAVSEAQTVLSAGEWAEREERFASENLMNWPEVHALHHMGATIASHCHYHTILHSGQPPSVAVRELRESKQMLDRELGGCDYFAFPNGRREDISLEAYQYLAEAGYKAGFTTIPGEVIPQCDPYLMPRIAASNELDLFAHRISTAWLRQREYQEAANFFRASAVGGRQCAF